MKTVIYYFSGTGNSLIVAKNLTEKLQGEMANISPLMELEEISTDAEVIGIVYPVYNHIIPFIVKRFIGKLFNLKGKYVFGVCTYGDSPCLSLEFLEKEIVKNGGVMAAGFAVHMPYNYVTPSFVLKDFYKSFTLREIQPEVQNELFRAAESKVEQISEFVRAKRTGPLEITMKTLEHFLDNVGLRETLQKKSWLKIAGFMGTTTLPFMECVQLMDSAFHSVASAVSNRDLQTT